MSNFDSIKGIMDGYNPHRALMEQTRKLVKKWEPTGLLEGITEENKTHGMAVLLENQARQLIDESSKTGTQSNSEEWAGVALPLVRRIFGELAAQDFVSVQPMNLPSGLIFYLDFKYGSAQPGFTQNSDVFGNTSGSGDATGGLYGAGKFGYSINEAESGNHAIAALTGSATLAMIDFDNTVSESIANLKYYLLPISGSSNGDIGGIRAWEPVGNDSALTTWYPAFTKPANSSNEVVAADAATHIRFVVDENAKNDTAKFKYHKQPTDITRGDFEASPTPGNDGGFSGEGDVGIPEIDISLRSIPIVAKTRKLKAVWTPELAQDLNAYHSVDAEAELTSLLSEYISMEIDLEILDMLISEARTTEKWSAENNKVWDGSDFVTSTSDFYNTQGQWFQTLGTKIQKVSNKIHQKTLRGGANFIVTSPTVATILESIPGYAAATDGDAMEFNMGVQRVGSLANRFKVYKNPYMTENILLLGFRGSQFLETGAVYAPYVPLLMTPLVYDPETFTPRKGLMTRYAKKMIRPEFYGKIFIANTTLI